MSVHSAFIQCAACIYLGIKLIENSKIHQSLEPLVARVLPVLWLLADSHASIESVNCEKGRVFGMVSVFGIVTVGTGIGESNSNCDCCLLTHTQQLIAAECNFRVLLLLRVGAMLTN